MVKLIDNKIILVVDQKNIVQDIWTILEQYLCPKVAYFCDLKFFGSTQRIFQNFIS